MLETYIKDILGIARQGDATEESYYPALKDLLMQYAASSDKQDIHVTILPKKTEAGNPDFRVWDGKQKIIGYIEAKTPDANLDQIEGTEQITRYKSTFKNFMLSNFFEFRLYKDGSLVDKLRIADPKSIYTLKGIPSIENEEKFENSLDKFFSSPFPSITSAETLAIELAKRTRFLRDEVVAEELREEEKDERIGQILGFYEAFQTYLIRGLTKQQFADLYSQTITYGLFASRMRSKGEFNRKIAVYDIPHTIGILRDIFNFISLGDLPPQLEWIVDEISNVLANVDVKKIFSEFFRNGKGEDPVFHFYETFLAKYDPEEREKRGVYYTPKPVVSYIVRSLHILLKGKFGLENGLGNENVTILDPAAGTLTFLAEAIKEATKEIVSKFGEGTRSNFIKEHILKNFYAFELMVAPYAIGHLKISFLLEEFGYILQEDERVKFYLTNTLELEEIEQTALPGMASLAEESRNAGAVKKKIPILVILANPPYSGMSANRGEWITNLVGNYKFVDSKPLEEKNPKWLLDDYVKFIRFAEWKINKIGMGVIGYITNHSYLDNPTFRGMRQHLMGSFDEIYVLDLHGNSLKKERCPDGSKDENVFDIRQGVAISIFAKKKDKPSEDSKVFHGEVWGLRERKYEWLDLHNIKTTEWEEVQPTSPFYFFVPREERYRELYTKYWKITDIFSVNSVGIVTARDRLTIQDTPKEVWRIIQDFSSIPEERARTKYNLGKDARDWKVALAQQDLKATGLKKELVVRVLYRPFDARYTYYTGHSRGFVCMPRPEIMRHMMKENLAICVGRAGQVVGLEKPWNIVFCSESMTDFNLFYRGGNVNFPLYLYSNKHREPNINKVLLKELENKYGGLPSPDEILQYIYSILYSNTYRTKYAEFLKTDFPSVPFTTDHDLFAEMVELGKKLVNLHLMRSELLSSSVAKFQGHGDHIVEKPMYNEEEGRVYINQTQYFEGIGQDVWEYQIGGYQILYKWLKDRKNRRVSLYDIKHYCKIVTAIQQTIEIQYEIDNLYPNIERDLIPFKEEKVSLQEYAK
jgi:type I restriction-modification system DNA methylase subunit